ncbi:MAG TPA: tetratricopeptide repeat protein, partial [Gemmatimonadales bacterium]|nr:tetratricopeptide repeat protein [Gemmatimonadales bacterium]
AKAAYERQLASDSTSVRSLYRLAVLASWDGQLDSALALAARARRVEPGDPDVRLLEAQVLSWQGRLGAALAKYDSLRAALPERTDVALARARTLAWANRFDEADAAYAAILAREPGNHDALTGRAQVAAWRGDLARAAGGYRAVLAQDAKNADALVGLGQVYYWQGRADVARRQVAQALAADSMNAAARDLDRLLRAELRPQVETGADWTNDSDHNTSWTLHASATGALVDGVRVFGATSWARLTDPGTREAAERVGGEAGLGVGLGALQLTGAAGLRRLTPATRRVVSPFPGSLPPAPRTAALWRAAAALRLGATTSLGLGYAHAPFDETAVLADRGLDLDALEASLETTLPSGTALSLGVGQTWLGGPTGSEDNVRRSVVVGVTQTVARQFYVGVLGRMLGWDEAGPGRGYFAPSRFSVGEVRAGWRLAHRDWESGLSGGLGMQQIEKGVDTQAEWHVEGRLARRFGAASALELFGAVTNSAAVTSSVGETVASYRYRTAGVRVRLGL